MSTNEIDTPIQPDEDVNSDLQELLAGVTSENLHPEVDTGERVGEEVW